ncbi:hypothetical protein [Thiofilum flexile]|uniref:hypothetical protein n=1 Tax=Thiofilum flexile TaxID=125627 RepID=UPI00036C94F5|nr:hypothetical protein [Thiofilum flexile]
MALVYEEIIDFIAAGTTPDKVIAFRPSEASNIRVSDLIHKSKSTTLSVEEVSELEHYLRLEHLMRMAKARAQKLLIQ